MNLVVVVRIWTGLVLLFSNNIVWLGLALSSNSCNADPIVTDHPVTLKNVTVHRVRVRAFVLVDSVLYFLAHTALLLYEAAQLFFLRRWSTSRRFPHFTRAATYYCS